MKKNEIMMYAYGCVPLVHLDDSLASPFTIRFYHLPVHTKKEGNLGTQKGGENHHSTGMQALG